MVSEIEKLIKEVHYVPYDKSASNLLDKYLQKLQIFINENHFVKHKFYESQINLIKNQLKNLSSFRTKEDRLFQLKMQKQIADLARLIIDENKKIFIVHGRNINMRDKVSALLGKLKLDYVILESEYNSGSTIIEKFLRNAEDCRYAVILFSADDIGKLNHDDSIFQKRTRQNVILELGFFLGKIGRKNIIILHETDFSIEKPSDFDGIVYEPFDNYGAWKNKLIKEMKRSSIFIDPDLADKV